MTSSQSFVLRRYFHLTENLILKFTSKSAKKGEEKNKQKPKKKKKKKKKKTKTKKKKKK